VRLLRTTRTLLASGIALVALAAPAFTTAGTVSELFPVGIALADGNGTGNVTNSTHLVVQVTCPAILLAGANASCSVAVGWSPGSLGNNTTGPTHHVDLSAALLGVNGTAQVDPSAVDVPEGGWALAQVHLSVSPGALPGFGSVVVYATEATESAQGQASFLVV